MKDTVILRIGNILLKDDSVGVYALRRLETEKLPFFINGGYSFIYFFLA